MTRHGISPSRIATQADIAQGNVDPGRGRRTLGRTNTLTLPAQAYPSILNPSSGAYFGAFVLPRGSESKEGAVERLEGKIGRKLKIDHSYYKWNSPIPMSPQQWDKSTGRIPFINWNSRTNSGSYIRWSAIANGSQDAWIQQRADAFRAFASPVYLAFHHEPEDDTGTFGTAADYAAAFRRIVTVFRQRNVTNVAFVWTMMAWTFDGRSGRNPMDYYPETATSTSSAPTATTGTGSGRGNPGDRSPRSSHRRWYGRIYVWLGTDPGGGLRLVRAASNGTLRFAIDVLASGELRVVDNGNNTIASSPATIATGTWIRIEWSVSHSQGRVQVRLFNNASSSSPSATLVSAGGSSIGSSAAQVQLGRSGSQDFSVTFWTDEPAISTGGFLGPI